MVSIPKHVSFKRSTSSGRSCFYFPISKRTGLKVFRSKKDCERCYILHKIAVDNPITKSLVPAIRSGIVKVGRKWTYAVETVHVFDDGGKWENRVEKAIGKMEERTPSLHFTIREIVLRDGLDTLSTSTIEDLFDSEQNFESHVKSVFLDSHEGNFGLRKGKLIWIDFSNHYYRRSYY